MSDFLSRCRSRFFRLNNHVNPLCSELYALRDLISGTTSATYASISFALLNRDSTYKLQSRCPTTLITNSASFLLNSVEPNPFTESKHQILKINTWTEILCFFNNEVVFKTTWGHVGWEFEPWKEESRVRRGMEILREWLSLILSRWFPFDCDGFHEGTPQGRRWRMKGRGWNKIHNYSSIAFLLSSCPPRMKDLNTSTYFHPGCRR